MIKNDILRRIRYALNISNSEMVEIFKLMDHDISEAEVLNIIKKEDSEGYVECSDKELELFLDGLIIFKRGKKETIDSQTVIKPAAVLSNNMVLKKLRIALNFRETDMLEMFRISEFEITKPELSALFRKKGHKNYKVCGDQIMKYFLKGVTAYYKQITHSLNPDRDDNT